MNKFEQKSRNVNDGKDKKNLELYENIASQIMQFKQGSKLVKNQTYRVLVKMYDPLIMDIATKQKNKVPNSPLEIDDYILICQNEFRNCLEVFDPSRGVFFSTFLSRFLTYSLKNYSQKFSKRNHQVLNYAVHSIEEYIGGKEVIRECEMTIVEKKILALVNIIKSNSRFNDRDKEILSMLMLNKNVNEIAYFLNIEYGTALMRLRRFQNKVNTLIDVDDYT